MKTVHVHASAIAGLIGRHTYCKRYESFEKLWERIDPSSYREAYVRNAQITPQEKIDTLMARVAPEIPNLITRPAHTAASLATIIKNNPEVASEDINDVMHEVQSRVYTQYGIQRESSTLETVRVITKLDLVAGNDVYHKCRIGVLDDGTEIYLGGKIDAITRDGTVVIEIKNRINRLFFSVPHYERIQVQAYLSLFPKASHALLVESLNGPAPEINIMRVDRDDTYWTQVCQETCATLDLVMRMCTDRSLQDAYLNTKQRSAFLRRRLAVANNSLASSSHLPQWAADPHPK